MKEFKDSLRIDPKYPYLIISDILPLHERIDIVDYLREHTKEQTEEKFNIVLISVYFYNFGQNIMGYVNLNYY